MCPDDNINDASRLKGTLIKNERITNVNNYDKIVIDRKRRMKNNNHVFIYFIIIL